MTSAGTRQAAAPLCGSPRDAFPARSEIAGEDRPTSTRFRVDVKPKTYFPLVRFAFLFLCWWAVTHFGSGTLDDE